MQVFAYCKQSKTGDENGLETRLVQCYFNVSRSHSQALVQGRGMRLELI